MKSSTALTMQCKSLRENEFTFQSLALTTFVLFVHRQTDSQKYSYCKHYPVSQLITLMHFKSPGNKHCKDQRQPGTHTLTVQHRFKAVLQTRFTSDALPAPRRLAYIQRASRGLRSHLCIPNQTQWLGLGRMWPNQTASIILSALLNKAWASRASTTNGRQKEIVGPNTQPFLDNLFFVRSPCYNVLTDAGSNLS